MFDEQISKAINNRFKLRFNYNGYVRDVDPHVFGVSTTGEKELRCWHSDGGSSIGGLPDWRTFKTKNITNLTVSDNKFTPQILSISQLKKGFTIIFTSV